uniref:NADH dehydrogenase subunit 3 n=1 Tax=Elodes marginata TaxID=446436 RepID=UPI0020294636|nr:NADH dehydrogenase subunit 3 [Elodes marginata]UPL65142.1 NADH dehydrogenase subunit 3 [Elodes marginata]
MKILMVLAIVIMTISSLMMILVSAISKKTSTDREKSSPFECGFDPKNSSRLPFSLHFFLIAVIFLIFDVEIALLMPMILIMNMSNVTNYTIIIFLFLLILLIGLYHEWAAGALNWAI